MAQEARITTILVDHAEDLLDTWNDSWKDGVLDLTERRQIEDCLKLVYRQSVDVDESAAITVAMLRLGPDAPRVERLMGERRARLRLVVKNDHLALPTGPSVA